jgi:hypothetical protein
MCLAYRAPNRIGTQQECCPFHWQNCSGLERNYPALGVTTEPAPSIRMGGLSRLDKINWDRGSCLRSPHTRYAASCWATSVRQAFPSPLPSPVVHCADADVLDAMRKAQIALQFVYAFKKTGLMGFGDLSAWPADRRDEWLAAVEEYTALSAASAGQSATRSGDLVACGRCRRRARGRQIIIASFSKCKGRQ